MTFICYTSQRGSRNCAIAQRERKLRSAGAYPGVGMGHFLDFKPTKRLSHASKSVTPATPEV